MNKLLLLDIDGTVIDTPHYEAWKWAAEYLGMAALTPTEYAENVAGLPRAKGAEKILSINGEENSNLAGMLSELKQTKLMELSVDIRLFPDAERLLKRVIGTSTQIFFYTASLNAARFLEKALRMSSFNEITFPMYVQQATETRLGLIKRCSADFGFGRIILVDDAMYSAEIAGELNIKAYRLCRELCAPAITSKKVRVITTLDNVQV